MARIAGIELAKEARVDYALTRIKGIGWPLSKKILDSAKIDSGKRVSALTNKEITKIATSLEKYPLEGELLRKIKGDITRLTTIGSYRGIRHLRSLPVRGQRTRTNARTKRGKRKTVGAFKKEILSRMQTGKEGVSEKKGGK